MMGRYALLKNDIELALDKISSGSYLSKLDRTFIFNKLHHDLIAVDKLSHKLSGITPSVVMKLITHWNDQGNSETTIRRKVSVIRRVITQHLPDFVFPSNHELNIKTVGKHKSVILSKVSYLLINHALIQDICALQYHFGLKKMEAIRYASFMLDDARLFMPRSTAYNNKDRTIPIITDQQKQFVPVFKQKYPITIANKCHTEKVISLLYDAELKNLGIIDSNHFRYHYIQWRYQHLTNTPNVIHQKILQLLRSELGYKENLQIKGVLACLENS